jgi:hypothetical protein
MGMGNQVVDRCSHSRLTVILNLARQWLADAVQAWLTLMVNFITIRHRIEFLVDRGHTLVDALAVTCPKTSSVFLNPSSSCRLHPHYRVPDL